MKAIGNSYKQIISELTENFRLSFVWKFKKEQVDAWVENGGAADIEEKH